MYYYEQRGLSVLRYLTTFYTNHVQFLPPEYRADNVINKYNLQKNKEDYQQRLICDYISGMMDSYAISVYEQITGKAFSNILGE